MKKLVILSTVCATFVGLSAFGQGYINFSTAKSQIYDTFTTPGTGALNSTVDVALLWGAVGATPTVDSIAASTPVSGTVSGLSGAWSAILNDPNFSLADNFNTGTLAVGLSTTRGAITFGNFGVTGSAVGVQYACFLVSWNAIYSTPALASAGNSAVGWSGVFDYTTTAQTAASGPTLPIPAAFGTIAVPEPTTIALGALGGLSLLMFRRRK